MSASQKIKHEIRAILLATLYFGIWIGALLVIKSLILAQYNIAFHGLSMALVGALILSKVVHFMKHVSLGSWVRSQPPWVEVIARTVVYSLGVLVVLILEKGIEGRHEHGGFSGAVEAALRGAGSAHVWANIVCVTGALLIWNAAGVVESHFGKHSFRRVFLVPKTNAPASEI